ETIFVGQYLYKGLLKTLDWPAMHRRANEILTRLEVQIDPRATLKTLSIAQRHMVAIARALAFDAQVVILDEFHERSLQADLALALLLDVQQGLRDDLKLLIMSATLDNDRLQRLLPEAPVVVSEGRAYPVERRFSPLSAQQRFDEAVAVAAAKTSSVRPKAQRAVFFL
ncbi:hypothetical protein MKP05_21680, partial [Halomonas sp. EGI 63088]|nr:hypothetical protein [Halomonas flagellata]